MKKVILFVLFINVLFPASMFGQAGYNRQYTKKQARNVSLYNCNRIQTGLDQNTGERFFRTPLDANGTFQSMSIPDIYFTKLIDSSGVVQYFMTCSIGVNHVAWNEDINTRVFFEDGKKIEKHSKLLIEMNPFMNRYIADMPLDSAEVEIFRTSEIDKIMLMSFPITGIGLSEYFFYYLDCLVEKK